MKNHELLELIGDVNEDYVLEAEDNVVKPRFGWRKLAVCAACAALVLAYPVYRAVPPPLHSYTVLEDATGPQVLAQSGSGTPELSTPEPAPAVDDQHYDVSAQARANAQYQGLLNGMGGQEGCEPKIYPDWYGGSWIHDTGQAGGGPCGRLPHQRAGGADRGMVRRRGGVRPGYEVFLRSPAEPA